MRILVKRFSPALWIVLAFVLSRLSYYAAGVEFDARPLQFYVQFIDPELLRTRLLESLFYLHTQPPGFNLLAGIVLKLFPDSYAAAFHSLYLAMGLGSALLLARLMQRLGVHRGLAAALATAFIVSPAAVLYENHLTYEYPILFLMCAAAAALAEWIETRALPHLALFQASLLGLMLIRGTYQPVYYLAICAALWLAFAAQRRTILRSAVLPLAVVLALSFKNWMLFGAFNTGSWPGFQAAIMTAYQLSPQERDALEQRGLLTRAASVPPIMPLADYPVRPQAPTGIPVLDHAVKSTGAVNANHLAFLEVQKLHLADARAVLREKPAAVLKALATAWFTYFLPSTDFPFFDHNRPRIAALDRAVNLVLLGQFRDAKDRKQLRRLYEAGAWTELLFSTATFLLIGLPLVALGALWRVAHALRRRQAASTRVFLPAFLLFNIVFVTVVSNLASCYENNRYRFSLDAFYLVLAAILLTTLWEQFASTRRRRCQ